MDDMACCLCGHTAIRMRRKKMDENEQESKMVEDNNIEKTTYVRREDKINKRVTCRVCNDTKKVSKPDMPKRNAGEAGATYQIECPNCKGEVK